MRVLIVEDHVMVANLVKRIVFDRAPEASVTVAGCLADATQHVAEADVVVADLDLPDSRPEETFEWAARWHGRGIHVVVLSAWLDRIAPHRSVPCFPKDKFREAVACALVMARGAAARATLGQLRAAFANGRP